MPWLNRREVNKEIYALLSSMEWTRILQVLWLPILKLLCMLKWQLNTRWELRLDPGTKQTKSWKNLVTDKDSRLLDDVTWRCSRLFPDHCLRAMLDVNRGVGARPQCSSPGAPWNFLWKSKTTSKYNFKRIPRDPEDKVGTMSWEEENFHRDVVTDNNCV